MSVWIALHLRLREVVTEHLRNRGVDIELPNFSKHQLNDYWSDDAWRSEQDLILGSHNDLDRDEVALMLCCVTGRMPIPVKESPDGKSRPLEQTILDQALRYLEQLSAASPEWEVVPDFLSSVAVLAYAKKAEREVAASREVLETQTRDFLDRHSDLLEYLELTISGWTVPHDCDESVVSGAIDLLEQLSDLIDEYNSIPSQGATHAETMRLHRNRDRQVQRIGSLKSKLDGLLFPNEGPDETPSQPFAAEEGSTDVCEVAILGENSLVTMDQPESPEKSTDATLSGMELSDAVLDFDPATLCYLVPQEHSADFFTIAPVANHSGATIEVTVESKDDDAIRQLQSKAGVLHCAEHSGRSDTHYGQRHR